MRLTSAILDVTHRKFTGQLGADKISTGWSESWVGSERCSGAKSPCLPPPHHTLLPFGSGLYQNVSFLRCLDTAKAMLVSAGDDHLSELGWEQWQPPMGETMAFRAGCRHRVMGWGWTEIQGT